MANPDQPRAIHPDVISRLDQDYIDFHNANIAPTPGPYAFPWDPELRKTNWIPGGSEVLEVGSVKEYDLTNCKVRVFTPDGSAPEAGWPVYVWYHGGGWTLGGIDAETNVSTRICKGARCVVVHPDYRLAPEHPHPAAVEDSFEALQWVHSQGHELLNVDVSTIAIGGSFAGANLAAIVSLKAVEMDPPIRLEHIHLLVPALDNSKDGIEPYASRTENTNAPWLNAELIGWFRDKYLPEGTDRTQWDVSPIYAPEALLAKLPPHWIAVTELDILRDEGLAYVERLKKAGVEVTHKMYPKAVHHLMDMDGVLSQSRELVLDTTVNIGMAFGTL